MTDHDAVDHHALDRRAAAAVAELDRAVDATPVPDFEAAPSGRRSVPAVAIAAGLLVIALVVAAVVFAGGGDEQSTVADQGDFSSLVLPDPESYGWVVQSAFDGTEPADAEALLAIPVSVLGPAESDDPWSQAVVSYALPSDVTTLGGDPVDIGGPDATLDSGIGPTVGWSDGDRIRYLVSSRVDEDALVTLARAAVADPDEPVIDGQRLLFRGQLSDVFPSLLVTIGRGGNPFAGGTPTAAVFYGDEAEDGQSGMVVATSRASDAALRAYGVLATSTRDITVRGRPGVAVEFSGEDEMPMRHIAWLEDSRTLVRVDAVGIEEADLLERLERLEPVGADTFAALVREHRIEDPFDRGSFEEAGEPISPTTSVDARTELASVSFEDDGATVRATLTTDADGGLGVETMVETVDSGSGSGQAIESTSTNTVIRDVVQSDGYSVDGVLLAGLVGPAAADIAVVDTNTGERISETEPGAVGPSIATIPGSDHVLFLATVGPEWIDRDLAIVATLADGSEVTLEAPAG